MWKKQQKKFKIFHVFKEVYHGRKDGDYESSSK